jgi:hypothetical protein
MSLLDKLVSRTLPVMAALLMGCGAAHATLVSTIDAFVSASDPTQQGRLSRNGVAQDWSGGEAFPGLINTGSSYHYHVYDLDMTALEGTTYGGYIQISLDSNFPTTFLAAYLNTYDPTSEATLFSSWLGDDGSSGNFFGTDPRYFQVYVPENAHLLLVLNESVTNGGLNQHGNVLVEAFQDSMYTDLPEPGSLALCIGALAAAAAIRRKQLSKV